MILILGVDFLVCEHFFEAKKNEGDLRLPRRRSVGTPLAVDCRSS